MYLFAGSSGWNAGSVGAGTGLSMARPETSHGCAMSPTIVDISAWPMVVNLSSVGSTPGAHSITQSIVVPAGSAPPCQPKCVVIITDGVLSW